MVRPLAVMVMLVGCASMRPSAVGPADDVVVREARRSRSCQPTSEPSDPLVELATSPAPEPDEGDLEAAPLQTDMLPVVPDEPELPEAPPRPWREIVAELERTDPDSTDRDPESELTEVMTSMPAEAPDFVEATCHASRWMTDEWQIMRAISEVRRRAGSDVHKLYGSLRSTSKVDCARADVASFRLELAELGGRLDAAMRVKLEGIERMRRFGAAPRMDITAVRETTNRAALELSGLRTEVAAAAPGSLELSNLDEIIRQRCEAAETEDQVCAAPSIESLAQLVKVRVKAFGAKHTEVAAARLRYARALLASSDAKQRSLGEKQLRTILSHAVSGSTSRALATAELVVILRIRQDTARALVLERAFVTELASPTPDRDVTLLGGGRGNHRDHRNVRSSGRRRLCRAGGADEGVRGLSARRLRRRALRRA